ncbi:MAG: gliding motility-associated C-terminal domain-containing protein [Bacteroidales bacterium]|nr:gliding motility-associated C-terminal domain-containing protein [Bacteroidales bacterium]
MKKTFLLVLLFGIFNSFAWKISAQITIFTENFNSLPNGLISMITPVGGWLSSNTSGQLTDGIFEENGFTCINHTYCIRNVWSIYDGGTSPFNAISGKSAGISGFDGNTLAGQFNYWIEAETRRWIMHPLDLKGYKNINLKFRWKCMGDNDGTNVYDYGSVHISTDNGVYYHDITTGGVNNSGKYYGTDVVQDASINLPALFNNNANLILAFKWTSEASAYGNGPTFVIDDIVITGCPYDGGKISPQTTTFVSSGSTTLTVSGVVPGVSYQWESAPSISGPWTDIPGATSASYTTPEITVTTYFRCRIYSGTCTPVYQTPAVVNIGAVIMPSIMLDPVNDTICAGDKVSFDVIANGTEPLSYAWEVSEDNGSTWNKIMGEPYADYNTDTLLITSAPESYNGNLYRCVVSDAVGSDTSAFAELVVNGLPIVNAGNDTTINPSSVAILNASVIGGSEPYKYSWSPTSSLSNTDSSMVLASPSVTTTYTVHVYDNNNCASSDDVVVNIETKVKLVIPNVMTPNNDMINDVFNIQFEGITAMNVSIFNRWGYLIANYDGMVEQWDGKTKSGEMVAEGTYFYYIEVTDVDGNKNHYNGSLTVLFE